MITRLKIDGFKSLVDIDIQLGPFTCIAGANAVGKSNLFDALIFLSALADKTVVEAAKTVRSDGKKHNNIKDIFHKYGDNYSNKITFEISMLIKQETEDDLGQQAKASITSVQYNLVLIYNGDNDENEPIIIEKEELLPIPLRDAKKNLHFAYNTVWTNSVIIGRRTVPFISTNDDQIQIHQEGRGGLGKYKPQKMQRTLLSNATSEYPTAFMVRHEMRSWKMLQLEPAALRTPDYFEMRRNAQIASNGAHLPATLYRLKNEHTEIDIYQQIANKLATIVDGLDYVSVDKDEKRELLTLQVRYSDGAVFPANSLSDGTLRFLGLAVLEIDNSSDGIICFEEPENGIHPSKIEEIIELLKQIAVNTNYAVDENNPFRQVIINTHSPVVVGIVPDDSLLMADVAEYVDAKSNKKFKKTIFKILNDTWRDDISESRAISKGELLKYLYPSVGDTVDVDIAKHTIRKVHNRAGMNPYNQPELPFLKP